MPSCPSRLSTASADVPECCKDIFASHLGNDAINPWFGYSSAYGIRSGDGHDGVCVYRISRRRHASGSSNVPAQIPRLAARASR